MSELPVYERFHSWQGEGIHLGKSAFFIRLHGCPVHCPWCDSAGTWHPKHKPENVEHLECTDLADEAFYACPEIVVITGGEPAIHDLVGLSYQLRSRNLPVHIETCGAFPIMGEMDWVTVSPKSAAPPIEETFELVDEWKIIVENEDSIETWCEAIPFKDINEPVWLHPEWSQSQNPKVLKSINEWVKEHGAPFRAGFQMHKLFLADEEDERSRPEASLSHLPDPS